MKRLPATELEVMKTLWAVGPDKSFDSRVVLNRLYGSPRNFVAALAREGLRKDELEELQALLDQLNRRRIQ